MREQQAMHPGSEGASRSDASPRGRCECQEVTAQTIGRRGRNVIGEEEPAEFLPGAQDLPPARASPAVVSRGEVE